MFHFVLSVVWAFTIACTVVALPSFDLGGAVAIAAPVKNSTLTLQGTIRLVGVEGGCYQLVAVDGTKYELIGKFPRRDGQKVQVSGVIKTDMMTICQVGQPLQVTAVKILKKF